MSELISQSPYKLGENGHSEYTWSNNIRERIIQLSFQLTRATATATATKTATTQLSTITSDILSQLKHDYQSQIIPNEVFVEYMSIMFRLIGHTRDIIDGKGEYNLSYMLLSVWLKHYPDLAFFAFDLFVLGDSETHPYGSWKDVKYMIDYMEQQTILEDDRTNLHLFTDYAISLINNQLRIDMVSDNPSLAAKWVPREKSRFADLFGHLARNYFPEYEASAFTEISIIKAQTKAKMDYRKVITGLNKKLDTVQIKQCANTWSTIEPTKQTSITMHKQKKAFLNLNKRGQQRSTSDDRIACGAKFREFAEKAATGEVSVKGQRIGLNDFTKDALDIIRRQQQHSSEAQLLNAQWVNNSLQNGALGKMIAMVDVSGSMSGEPMNAAIALGIRIAEKSLLGKRIITFSAAPTWVNLDSTSTSTFVSMVQHVSAADWGMNTNFVAALNLILDAIISQKMDSNDVEDMVLTILSDMQIDAADNSFGSGPNSLMELIENKYAEAGIRVCGKPYKPPHILFWNLRSTSGFPTLSTQRNTSMMSGFSPVLLNLFCEQGLDGLQSCSPWSLFVKSLEKERYGVMDAKIREVFC